MFSIIVAHFCTWSLYPQLYSDGSRQICIWVSKFYGCLLQEMQTRGLKFITFLQLAKTMMIASADGYISCFLPQPRGRKFGCGSEYLLCKLVQRKRVKHGVWSSAQFLQGGMFHELCTYCRPVIQRSVVNHRCEGYFLQVHCNTQE